jgi:Golgi nucleoside diphosphatase
MATAGLRLLPGKQADAILAAVLEALKATPFICKEDSVAILEGKVQIFSSGCPNQFEFVYCYIAGDKRVLIH